MLPRGITPSLVGWDVGLSVVERERVYRDVEAFIHTAIRLAPAHLRLGIRVLAAAFAVWMAVARLAGHDAAIAITAWRRLTGGPGGMLIRLLRSLALLAYAEHPLVRARLGEHSVAALQHDHRMVRAQQVREEIA